MTWVEPHHELVRVPPLPPPYAETFQVACWSEAAGIGVWLHLTSGTVDVADRWERQLAVVLPDRRVLASTAFVDGDTGVRVERPLDRWSIVVGGAVRPLDGGPHVAADVSLRSSAVTPPYDFGDSSVTDVPALEAKGHFEQHHTVTGSLTIDGTTWTFDGVGFRSRSWGARDYRHIGASTYLHASFPASGRSVMALRLGERDGHAGFERAVSCTTTCVSAVPIVDLPLPDGGVVSDSYDLVLGNLPTIGGRVVAAVPMSFVGRAQTVFGAGGHHSYVQAFTRFDWDGEPGFGISEWAWPTDQGDTHP